MARRPQALTFKSFDRAVEELKTRLTTDDAYEGLFIILERSIDEIVQVVYKTLGEYAGRIIVYVFSYDTFTQRRVPINQLFYRSTGTSRSSLLEGLWFPMTQFKPELNAAGFRIGKLEDAYLSDQRLEKYVHGQKLHPDDDIEAYGRYLRRELAVVGGWLLKRWKQPTTLGQVDPEIIQLDQTIVLEIYFRRLMDLQFFFEMICDDDPTVKASINDTTMRLTFTTHAAMMSMYDKTELSDVFVQTMLGIKEVRFY